MGWITGWCGSLLLVSYSVCVVFGVDAKVDPLAVGVWGWLVTIEIPVGLQWVSYLAGSNWPTGDEDAMFRIGEHWHASAEQLGDLIPALDRVRHATLSALSGQTATAAQEQFALLFGGDYSVDKLAEAMGTLGGLTRDQGALIEYLKLQVLAMLAIAAAEIGWALSNAYETFGASLAWIPAFEALTMAAIRQAALAVMKRIAAAAAEAVTVTGAIRILKGVGSEAAQEVVEEAAVEGGIQGYQQAKGHRDGFDTNQFKNTVKGAAAGGATAGGTHHRLSHVVGDGTTIVGKVVKGAVTHTVVGVLANTAGSLGSGGPVDPLSLASATTDAASGGAHGTHGTAQAPPPDQKVPPLNVAAPPPDSAQS